MLVVLLAILVALILIFCGDRGAKSIVTTAIHAGILIVAIFCMYRGLPPVLVTAGACLMISAVTMFYQNDGDLKSRIAFGSVVIVILVLIPVVFWFAGAANAEGFNSEQYEITDTNGYTRNIDMNMLQLQISVMLIALIGTVIDIPLPSHRLFTKYTKALAGSRTVRLLWALTDSWAAKALMLETLAAGRA